MQPQISIRAAYFLLTIGLLFACSADYDYSTRSIQSISLSANIEQTTISVSQTLEFSVESSLGQDLTEAAEIRMDGELITGNTQSFSEDGTYSFTASYAGLTSNTLTYTVVSQRYMTVSHDKALRGQEVRFGFFDELGNDLTDQAQFFVEGTPLADNTFSSQEPGMYEVTVSHEDDEVEPQTFEVFVPKRKVVLEDYTGDWCGWCPRVLHLVEQVEDVTHDIVVLAVHVNDPMEFPQYQQLFNEFNISPALPRFYMNRTTYIPTTSDDDLPVAVQAVTDLAGNDTDTTLAINTSLEGDMLSVQVLLMAENALPESHKLVVYLYQNGLIYDQTNYYNNVEGSPWYQAGNPIVGFEHNHVLEAALTNLFGNNINPTAAYDTYSLSLPPVNLSAYADTNNGNTYDPQRFGVAVFLVDQDNNALNAQEVMAGESVGFE